MSKRFDIIEHCNSGCALLVDKTNELVTVPLGFSLDDLGLDEKEKLYEWLVYLNG